jgi:hypothetical protein
MSEFLNDERFVEEHRRVFVMLMGRDGYSEEMSIKEFPRLRQTVKPMPAQSPISASNEPAPALPLTGAEKWRSQRFITRRENTLTTAIA